MVNLRGGFFHSVGHTEVDGIDSLLRKLSPQIQWERCFPASNIFSPPKPIRSDQSESIQVKKVGKHGLTGVPLENEMLRWLSKNKKDSNCDLDLVCLLYTSPSPRD